MGHEQGDDVGGAEPLREIRLDVRRRVHGRLRSLHALARPCHRRLGGEEDGVALADQDNGDVGEDAHDRSQDQRVVGRCKVVQLDPLGQQAVVVQPLFCRLVELLREEVGYPSQPGIRRLGDDEIELLSGPLQIASPVVEDEGESRRGLRAVVARGEIFRCREYRGLDFTARDAHVGNEKTRACRRSAAEADDEEVAGGRTEKAREICKAELRQHVAAGAGVDLPVHVEPCHRRCLVDQYVARRSFLEGE